jgi:hypothetical protein
MEGGTYKEPKANMRHKAIRFRTVKGRPLSSRIGRSMMTKSSKIENTDAETAKACIFIHL